MGSGRATRDALAVAVQIGQPVLLWGGPGEGKSKVIEQVASQLGRDCEVVVGSVREATDFVGLPMRLDDGVTFAPPRWAMRCMERPDTVVFLDELTTAQPSVQAAMLRVVLEREVGDLQLPPTVSFVAAANPAESSAGGDDLTAPLANRFCHLDWQADAAEWVSGMLHDWDPAPIPVVPDDRGAVERRWRALLAGFISARPSALRQMPTDVESQGRAWPSPRSWDHTFRLVAAAEAAGCEPAVSSLLAAGLVGTGTAIEFLRFATSVDLPDPEDLLADPTQLQADVRIDLLLASLAGVSAAVAADPTLERWHAAWSVLSVACDAGRADVAALAAIDLIDLRGPGWPAPASAAAFAPTLRAAELI